MAIIITNGFQLSRLFLELIFIHYKRGPLSPFLSWPSEKFMLCHVTKYQPSVSERRRRRFMLLVRRYEREEGYLKSKFFYYFERPFMKIFESSMVNAVCRDWGMTKIPWRHRKWRCATDTGNRTPNQLHIMAYGLDDIDLASLKVRCSCNHSRSSI